MITNRERERQTLNFQKPEGRGTVAETFGPWDLTTDRFKREGLKVDIYEPKGNDAVPETKYHAVRWGQEVTDYETYLGFDPIRRVQFHLPFRCYEEKVVEETDQYIIRQDALGRHSKQNKNTDIVVPHKPAVTSEEDWYKLKELAKKELELYYTDEKIQEAYSSLVEGHERGDYSIRLHVEGFFWAPRELMGIEEHLFAFYDEPELMEDINDFILEVYQQKLIKVIDIIKPDVLYIMEDLSGKNGPMISPACFNEFVASYYKRIIPLLKEHGVGNVFVDTDGDFEALIPHFIAAGVDGFLPMDVNAGMDIVKVRKQFPKLKFIGSFNKLEIAAGPEAIDREFQRLMPVIRGGGYIPGSDHQVAPSTSLADYRYYIEKLKEAMQQCGADL